MIYRRQLISMALFAKDENFLIDAWDAEKKKVYKCAECGSKVRLRRVFSKFPHFYHLAKSPSCRLYSKSERHLLIQLNIQKLLPKGESVLEKPFPTIHRIGDLVWEKHKIVFEVQCSPISEKEANSRKIEYGALGYEIVWILDDKLFNQKQLRPAEKFLRSNLSYFVYYEKNIFYDQLELFSNQRRIKKGAKEIISLAKIKKGPKEIPSFPIPKQIQERLIKNSHYFGRDLIDQIDNPQRKHILIFWKCLEKKESKPDSVWRQILAKIKSWMNKAT
jgi:competence protein CoiA